MSAVGSAIAELEAKRAQIDDAIAVLRRVDGGGSVQVAAPIVSAGAVNGRTKKPKAGGRTVDADQAKRVRELYEQGVATSDIEKQTRVKVATIYYRAKVGKWKRPKTPAATGEQLPGKVRCPSCELWTERDPCENCGKKVRR